MQKSKFSILSGSRAGAVLAGALSANLFCVGGAFADSIGVVDEEAKTYTITWDSETDYEITAVDAAAASGYAIVKKGSGTVVSGSALEEFDGEIRIEEGCWRVTENAGLGTGAGGTIVFNGAALLVDNPTQDGLSVPKGEAITISGSGPDGNGAYRNVGKARQYYVLQNGGSFSLSDNATVGGGGLGVGGGSVNLNGNTLTVRMNESTTAFDFRCNEVATPGNVYVERGTWFLDKDTVWNGGSENVVTLSPFGMLGFRATTKPIPYKLVCQAQATIDGKAYAPRIYPSNNAGPNEWSGPVELEGGNLLVSYGTTANCSVLFSGHVSGSGGFEIKTGETLRLSCPSNSFEGGVCVNNGTLVVEADGALPPDGAVLDCKNGSAVICNGGMTLPDVSSRDECMISNAAAGSVVRLGNIDVIAPRGDHNAELDLAGGIFVTNKLDVKYGSLTLNRTGGISGPGLSAYLKTFSDQNELDDWIGFKLEAAEDATDERFNSLAAKMVAKLPASTVDKPELAYKAWGNDKYPLALYKGFFLNDSPTNAVMTFVASVADIYALWIDGKIVNKLCHSIPYSGGTQSTYFITRSIMTLAPGMHKFMFLVGHRNSSSYGPKVKTGDSGIVGANWAKSDFGLAWRYGTEEPDAKLLLGCHIDSSDYSAFENTSGRLMLFKDEDGAREDEANPALERFFSPVAASACFAPGTSLALCGGLPGLPYLVGDLSGAPSVSGGNLSVCGNWSPNDGQSEFRPLELSGATLSFGGEATLSYHPLPDPVGSIVVANAPPGSSIANAPSPAASIADRCRVRVVPGEGDACSLCIVPIPGTKIIVR